MTQQLEYRTATQLNVSFPSRIIELIVMPYDEPATVLHNGRAITEVCERGAYDGIETRSNRIKVNRDHDIYRTVGKAVALHPNRDEGLVAELRISESILGDETLILAADEVLDASAGFAVMAPDGESWNAARTERRLKRLWLGHIALTPDPAYEGARTLAVRTNTYEDVEPITTTPNLDLVRSWRLQKSWQDLSA